MCGFLHRLVQYQAWANAAFFDQMAKVDRETYGLTFGDALRLMSHCYVVADIFSAHLTGRKHGYETDMMTNMPTLEDLCDKMARIDQWYMDYSHDLTPDAGAEKLAFRFTDGDPGYMSRTEMIIHVVLHGGYHRGEIGQFLKLASVMPPWDTFAVFTHQDDPHLREQGRAVGLKEAVIPSRH
ncbi:DinB family protein [Thalassospira sp. TSL5-1]|uniref:DinB family protein n=1 Tax=Thalassospira sp. TSL5-1 TaxID=1544451 RepID=UPI000938CBBB|nr:DinB family protein [Thalassospira sp. TSL5-1]OKH87430.1 hypothetical protein LF95_11485 [Thalassospira sp. TSL5-1]